MFVRFQRQGARLCASLLQTRRVPGKVWSEHIGTLGSVDATVSVRERLAFWAKLPERLARLSTRVGADEHEKIYAALHKRAWLTSDRSPLARAHNRNRARTEALEAL